MEKNCFYFLNLFSNTAIIIWTLFIEKFESRLSQIHCNIPMHSCTVEISIDTYNTDKKCTHSSTMNKYSIKNNLKKESKKFNSCNINAVSP